MSSGESRDAIPLPALLLGWSGVIPFAALTAAAAAELSLPVATSTALTGYAVVILSFMGGAQWGLTVRAPGAFDQGWAGYSASVTPALLGWAALSLPFRLALPVLIAAFAGLLAYDLWTVRRMIAPGWYGSLRIQLTAAVIVLLSIAWLVL